MSRSMMDPLVALSQPEPQGDPSKSRPRTDPYRSIFYAKIVAGLVLLVSGLAQFVFIAVSPSWGLTVQTISDFRTGAQVNGFPSTVLSTLGTLNVGFVFAAAAVFQGLAYLIIGGFLHGPESAQMEIGVNPYVWIDLLFGHATVWLAFALLSGIASWEALTLFVTIVAGWLFFFWDGDVLNSTAYRLAMRSATGGTSQWSWAFLVWAAILFIIDFIVLFPFLVTTYSGANSASKLLVLTPLVGILLYLFFPIIVVLHYFQVSLVRSIKARELWLYIGNALYLIIITWLALVLFRFR